MKLRICNVSAWDRYVTFLLIYSTFGGLPSLRTTTRQSEG